jgi:hypothetical protein
MTRETHARTLLALSWGLIVSVAAYAAMRAVQAWTATPMDPAAIAPSIHVPFFWRILTVAYAGGFAAFIAATIARRHLDAVARALPPAALAAALLLALQSLVWP